MNHPSNRTSKNASSAGAQALRIIGGKWRSRKVTFVSGKDLRPTGDRIRETLFNWLQADISGSSCLEPYAGSGILSLEALSRGAGHVTLIEQDKTTVASLRRTFDDFTTPANYLIAHQPACVWLATCNESFDLVLLDPPFSSDELKACLAIVAERKIAKKFVYIESPEPIDSRFLAAEWSIHRQKKAGAVHYCLVNTSGEASIN